MTCDICNGIGVVEAGYGLHETCPECHSTKDFVCIFSDGEICHLGENPCKGTPLYRGHCPFWQ